jgi:multiple sugar transport system substrate-binding protein
MRRTRRSPKRARGAIASLVAASLLLAACADVDDEAEVATVDDEAADEEAADDEAADDEATDDTGRSVDFGSLTYAEMQEARSDVPIDEDVPDFGGVTVRVIGDAGHNMNPFGFWMPEFERAGIEIEVVEVPFAEVYSQQMAEFLAGSSNIDLVVFYPSFIGDYAGNDFIQPLDGFMEEYDPELDDVFTAFRELYLGWDGQTYALPFDGDVTMLQYRRDLLEHPDEQAAFEEEYGRELTVPETWDEYLEVGEFFTREAGEPLGDETLERDFYGCAEYGQRGFAYAWYMNRFASMGGVYFDEDMTPQIDSPEAIESLELMKAAVDTCSPPDVLNIGYDELRDVFINGDAFMVVQWSDVPKKAGDPEESSIPGLAGYAMVPGTEMADGTINHRSTMPVGRVFGIPSEAPNPEAAYWVAWYLTTQTSLFDVSTALTGLDPYRESHRDPSAYAMFDDEAEAEGYLDAVAAVLEVGFPEISIPGSAQYNEALDVAVTQALAGERPAADALSDAASEWERITESQGLDRQREFWSSARQTYQDLGLIND